jgi:hypothetical protein
MEFYLRLTHSAGRLDTLERLVDRPTHAEASDVAIRWLRLERNAHPDLIDGYDTWAIHESTPGGAGRIIVTGDASPLLAE